MKKLKIWTIAVLAISLITVSCKDEEATTTTPPVVEKVGIQGEWASSGSNVAPILVALFGTDSIYANFETNMSYTVEQFDTNGTKLTLSGVYTQTKSSEGDIYTIEVNQSSPAALVSEGIFEVSGSTMRYEIVQTSPDIGAIPPTPAGGFGSTNSGALGNINIQVYQKID